MIQRPFVQFVQPKLILAAAVFPRQPEVLVGGQSLPTVITHLLRFHPPAQSARGLAHSTTLRAVRSSSFRAPASWSAVALHRFFIAHETRIQIQSHSAPMTMPTRLEKFHVFRSAAAAALFDNSRSAPNPQRRQARHICRTTTQAKFQPRRGGIFRRCRS